MLKAGDQIEYCREVFGPPRQAGAVGERRTVGKDLSEYDANYLLDGGYVAPLSPSTNERKKGSGYTNQSADQKGDH